MNGLVMTVPGKAVDVDRIADLHAGLVAQRQAGQVGEAVDLEQRVVLAGVRRSGADLNAVTGCGAPPPPGGITTWTVCCTGPMVRCSWLNVDAIRTSCCTSSSVTGTLPN